MKMKIVGCDKNLLESKNSIVDVIKWTDWPVMYLEVYIYLVHTVSLYTGEKMRTYKSLNRFNFLVNRWLIKQY